MEAQRIVFVIVQAHTGMTWHGMAWHVMSCPGPIVPLYASLRVRCSDGSSMMTQLGMLGSPLPCACAISAILVCSSVAKLDLPLHGWPQRTTSAAIGRWIGRWMDRSMDLSVYHRDKQQVQRV